MPRTISPHSAATRQPARSPRGARHSNTTASTNAAVSTFTTTHAAGRPMSTRLW